MYYTIHLFECFRGDMNEVIATVPHPYNAEPDDLLS